MSNKIPKSPVWGGFLWLWDFSINIIGAMFRDGHSQHGEENLEEAQRAISRSRS